MISVCHPDAESALKAAKRACRAHPGRWYGRITTPSGRPAFQVYDGITPLERHLFARTLQKVGCHWYNS